MLWFRWYHGTCADPKLGSIARKTGETRERVIAVWALLLESASEAKDRGAVRVDAAGIADVLSCETKPIQAILDDIEARGMVKNGRISAWENRQPNRDDSKNRVQKWRQKKGDVTRYTRYRNADVTRVTVLDTEEDTEGELSDNAVNPPNGGLSAKADAPPDVGGATAFKQGRAAPPKPTTASPASIPAKGNKRNKPNKPEHAEVRDYFRARWKSKCGTEYAWRHGKDDAHVKWILDHVDRSTAEAKKVIDAFFNSEDPWIADRGYELGLLVSSFNKIRAQVTTGGGAAYDPDRYSPGFVPRQLSEEEAEELLGLTKPAGDPPK